MILSLVLGVIIIVQGRGTDGCLPPRTKELTDSYIPVGIQALNHYKSQLVMYFPYKFTPFCQTGKHAMGPQFPLQTDVCVGESLARINLFLIDLQREAARQNLEDSQETAIIQENCFPDVKLSVDGERKGLTRSVITDMEKTSRMSAAQQFHFILKKLQKEQIWNKRVGCKIKEFIQDLENSNSKLYRNFLNLKPLNYL